jgi:hypothetical protein
VPHRGGQQLVGCGIEVLNIGGGRSALDHRIGNALARSAHHYVDLPTVNTKHNAQSTPTLADRLSAHPDDSVFACRHNDRDGRWTRHSEIVIDPARSDLAESAG